MTADRGVEYPFTHLDPSPDQVIAALAADDWRQLRSLVARMNAREGSFGGWAAPKPNEVGSFNLGYSVQGELLRESVDFAYRHGFILRFDWGSWLNGARLLRYGGDPDTPMLAVDPSTLSPALVLALITAICRGDRFSEGTLLTAFDDGSMPKLFTRLLDFEPAPNRL